MNYQLNSGAPGVLVIDGVLQTFIPEDPTNPNWLKYLEWVADGNTASPPTVDSGVAIALCVNAIQAYMDAKAREYHYDSLSAVVSYADEPAVPKFQREGRAFRAWRSLVWEKAYAYLDEVNAGTKPIPTPKSVIDLIPMLYIPE
ncbi:hypothetical protein [Cupriavidus sp. RAF12]|uniref:hypothetical protein n=1 Tax=Cupriavidus sp. RAF12 TaxID=3233050 RepID=UPI003F920F2F